MTSSPTPAVLPDARAREVLIEKLREVAALEDRNMKRHAHAIRTFATEAADYLATPPASDAAVPAGFVLVPTEPTQKMIEAGLKVDHDHISRHGQSSPLGPVYSAMLAATPKVASDTDLAAENAAYLSDVHWWLEIAQGKGHGSITEALEAAPRASEVASDTGAITPEWCLRMAELEAGQEIGAGALDHPLRIKCELPPAGWVCTREPGHNGPCAAVASDTGAGLREALEEIVLICEDAAYACGSCSTKCGPVKAVNETHAAATAALATPTDATDGATGGGEVA